MGETASKIKKLTSGAVQLLNSSDVVLANLMERSRVKRLEQQDFIEIIDTSKTSYKLAAADITDLIIDPNPPVAFSGTNQDLFRKLTEDFFTDIVTDTSDDDLNLSNVSGETVTDALNTLSGGLPAFDPNAVHVNIANEISGIIEKSPAQDDDLVIIEDSAAAFVKKKVKLKNIPATFAGPIYLDGEINPATIAVDQDDYNPAGLATANVINLQSSGNISITGIAAPSPARNQLLYVFNVGTNNIQFLNNNAGSLAANRLLMGGNRTIQPDECIQFVYSVTFSRWKGVARNT